MRSSRRLFLRPRSLAVLTAALAAMLCAATPVAARPPAPPSPGAPTSAIRCSPVSATGATTSAHYTLELDVRHHRLGADDPGVVTIKARATQALSRFDLDFSGDSVGSVRVDGAPAAFSATARSWSSLRPADPRPPAVRACAWRTRPGRGRSVPRTPSDLNKVAGDRLVRDAVGLDHRGPAERRPPDLPQQRRPVGPGEYTFRGVHARRLDLRGQRRADRRADRSAAAPCGSTSEREPMASELIQLAFGGLTVGSGRRAAACALRDVAPTSQIDRRSSRRWCAPATTWTA